MKTESNEQVFITRIRTVFNDGSMFEGNEVQNALVCAFTAQYRGGIKDTVILESETVELKGDRNE